MRNMISDLEKLVAFKTIAGRDDEVRKLFDFVVFKLRVLGLKYKRYKRNGIESLVVGGRDMKRPKVLLQAHVDVVPGPDDLFTPRIVDGRLYGRGASDMKFAVAVYLHLFEKWHKEGVLDKLDVGMMLTSDEEVGGFNGVGWLVEEGYRPDVVFLPDGGDDWGLVLEEKGVYHFKLKAKGQSAHGSRPWQGDNAGEKLIRVYRRLKKRFRCSDPNKHWHNTLNLGKIEGGDAANKVMDRAVFYVDIRHTADVTKEEVDKWVREAIGKERGVSIEEIVYGNPFWISCDNKYVQLWVEQMKLNQVSGWKFVRGHGASDARFFSAKGIPVVIIKPRGGDVHSDKEWVDVKDLKRFSKVLDGWVKTVALK